MNPVNPLTLDELRELAPAYVMGTLDADERAAFERGMQNAQHAEALAPELDAHRAAMEYIAAAQPVEPPAALKARVLSRLAQEKSAAAANLVKPAAVQPPPVSAPVMKVAPDARATRVTPVRPTLATDDLASRRAAKSGRAGWYTAGALATALAASAIFTLDLRSKTQELEADLLARTAVLDRAEAKLKESNETLQTLLAGRGNVVLVNLNTTAPTGPGMQVFWNVRQGKAVVNAYGLAQVASDRAYMLWMIKDGKPVPLKLFTPDDAGRALVASIDIPQSTTGITLLAVTEESAQGATAPTMTPFLAGEVSTAAGVR